METVALEEQAPAADVEAVLIVPVDGAVEEQAPAAVVEEQAPAASTDDSASSATDSMSASADPEAAAEVIVVPSEAAETAEAVEANAEESEGKAA